MAQTDFAVVFDEIDTDNNGYIMKNELGDRLKSQNIEISQFALENAFNEIDTNDSNKIEKGEFVNFMNKTSLNKSNAIKAFETLDKDGNGWLSRDEMKCIIKKIYNNKFDEKQVNDFFEKMDSKNCDGRICKDEFMQALF